MYFSAAAEADNQKLHYSQFQIIGTKRKICAFTILAQMLPFVFSSHRCQTAFLQFGYQPAKKTWGVQRGISPWLWVSNRGEPHPCWHTILLAKSSVLYLLRPLTLERGCHHAGQTVSRGSRTGGFCGLQDTQNKGFAMSKIRLFGCSWRRKPCSCAKKLSVSTGAQEVYKNPPQRHA